MNRKQLVFENIYSCHYIMHLVLEQSNGRTIVPVLGWDYWICRELLSLSFSLQVYIYTYNRVWLAGLVIRTMENGGVLRWEREGRRGRGLGWIGPSVEGGLRVGHLAWLHKSLESTLWTRLSRNTSYAYMHTLA